MTPKGKKRGRKPKPFTAADGTKINGLRKRPSDGRWELSDGRMFTEPDEALALAKFRQLTRQSPINDVIILNKSKDLGRYGAAASSALSGLQDVAGDHIAVVDEDSFWARVRKEILTRPQWVAERVGIEQIGYLLDLKPPTELPSLKSLGSNWWDHAEVTSSERRKVRDAWDDFMATTGITDLRGIQSEVAVAFRDAVAKREWSIKTMRHRFNRVRRVLSFAQERALAVEECGRALTHLRFKLKRTRTITMPQPVSPADFKAMLSAAEGDDKAMILCMQNAGLYLQEVVRLRWDEIEGGCFVGQRQKKGQTLRVAVLWPETIEALSKIKRRGEFVFIAAHGAPLTASGAGKRFRALRTAANVPHVSGSHLRDGAYQAMAEGNINSDLCKLVVGHSCGQKDNYVLRNPKMVAPACEAIRAVYLPANCS